MDTDPGQGVDPFEDLMNSLGGGEPADDEAEQATAAEEGSSEAEAAEAPAEDAGTESEAEETEAVDFDGKTFAIPKGTPPTLVAAVKQLGHDLKANFTQKTQEAAEIRRQAEARLQVVTQQERLLSDGFAAAVQLKGVQDRLAQFEAVDWQTLADQDPTQATKLNLAYQDLQRQAQKLYQQWHNSEQQRQTLTAQQAREAEEQRQQRLAAGFKQLSKEIKGWSPELQAAIRENTLSYGYTVDELSRVEDPRLVKVLHDAAQWRKLQADKPKAMQKVADAPRVMKPGAPQPKQNQAALERLKKHGRIEDLASLL